MFLDDRIIALVKKEDRLKDVVQKAIVSCDHISTSVLTLIEARLILLRSGDPELALSISNTMSRYGIRVLPIDSRAFNEATHLIRMYPFLTTFDSFHVSTAMMNDEVMMSTDHVFPRIEGLQVRDPRKQAVV